MKKGFALIYATIFIIVISMIGFYVLSFLNKTNTSVINNVSSLRNSLTARSATEYAIMALQGHDFQADGCVNKITFTKGEVSVTIIPHYYMTDCSVCSNLPSDRCTQVSTKEENGNVSFYTVTNNSVTGQRLVDITYQKL